MSLEYIQRETGANPEFTIIWLHGLGADGHDFEPIVPELDLPSDLAIRFLFPHAPEQPVTVNGGMVMRAWYDILGLDIADRVDADGVARSVAAVGAMIENEINAGIASKNIVIAGFSQGGAIALQTALLYPHPLAGVIALSTYVPVPALIEDDASKHNRTIPIFMAHGSLDPVVPVTLGEQSYQFLQARDYDVTWHTYPMEHSVTLDEIRTVGRWLGDLLTQIR